MNKDINMARGLIEEINSGNKLTKWESRKSNFSLPDERAEHVTGLRIFFILASFFTAIAYNDRNAPLGVILGMNVFACKGVINFLSSSYFIQPNQLYYFISHLFFLKPNNLTFNFNFILFFNFWLEITIFPNSLNQKLISISTCDYC